MSIISKEFILPNPNSPKRRWRYTFICDICGNISSVWYSKKMFKCECESCRKGKRSKEEFILAARQVHGDKYDYSKVVYVKNKGKVTITCKKHGDFTQRCGDHLGGNGCRKCATEEKVESLYVSVDTWEIRLARFPYVTLLSSNVGWKSCNTFLCKFHGEFTAHNYSIVKAVELCPICLKYSHQRQSVRPNLIGTQCTLYCVYLPDNSSYKIGVTVQNLESRLNGVKYINIWSNHMEYTDAIDLEHYIHTKYKYLRFAATMPSIISYNKKVATGSSEQYSTSPIKTTEELVSVIKEYNNYRALHGQPCIESYLNGETPTE